MDTAGSGSGQNKVGHEEMLTAANSLDELKHQAINVLNKYLHLSQDLQGNQMLTGDAGATNIVTTEEVQHAQMNIQNRWDHLINTLRSNTHGYMNADSQNSSHIASVAGGLKFT
jgi:hypothetical protein